MNLKTYNLHSAHSRLWVQECVRPCSFIVTFKFAAFEVILDMTSYVSQASCARDHEHRKFEIWYQNKTNFVFFCWNIMKDFKEMSTIQIKDRGNAHFAKKQYELAIDCYSKAIVSNRTSCLKKPVYLRFVYDLLTLLAWF